MAHRTADEKIAKEVSQHGLRATRQPIAALRLLRRLKSHPTSAELHARILADQLNASAARRQWFAASQDGKARSSPTR